jgi:hypothetical protein
VKHHEFNKEENELRGWHGEEKGEQMVRRNKLCAKRGGGE